MAGRFYVFFLQRLAPVVATLARLPVGLLGLCEFPFWMDVPIWPAGFYFFEVAVGITLDVFFGVHHLLMGGRIILALFLV